MADTPSNPPAYSNVRSYPAGCPDKYHGLPTGGAGHQNINWILHLYEMNIESMANSICIIATFLMIIFVMCVIYAFIEIGGGIAYQSYENGNWIAAVVFDLIAAVAGIYAAVRGVIAFRTKTDATAKAFKLSMLILFITCVVVYIIKSIVQFDVAYDMLLIYGFSTFAVVITLIAGIIIGTLCCGYCYSQATRYQKYLEYYEEARHRSIYN